MRNRLLALMLGLVAFCPCAARARPIVLGTVGGTPDDEGRALGSLARALALELHEDSIDDGEVICAETVAEMCAAMQAGRVDLQIDGPFAAVAAAEACGSRPLLRGVRRGKQEVHSVIFARADSGVAQIEDLAGKVIAFEGPASSFGYLFPKFDLIRKGANLKRVGAPTVPVAAGDIGYVFSRDDENTMVWVLRGKVQVGAMDDQMFELQAKQSADELKVVHETSPLPVLVVSAGPGLSVDLEAKLAAALAKVHEVSAARKALAELAIERFEAMPPQVLTPLNAAKAFIVGELGVQ